MDFVYPKKKKKKNTNYELVHKPNIFIKRILMYWYKKLRDGYSYRDFFKIYAAFLVFQIKFVIRIVTE